jgi:agmatine deiminase
MRNITIKNNKYNKYKVLSNNKLTTPLKDGYYMPAEFDKQESIWLGWPSNAGTFITKDAQNAIEKVARHISKYQKVHIVCPPSTWNETYKKFIDDPNIYVTEIVSDDNWLRDIAPTFLVKNCGNNRTLLRAVGWKFNGWGKPKEIKHELDELVALKISNFLSIPFYKKFDFVCEGGSYSVDGKGTLITTKECLLNKNRNPNMTKEEIEEILEKYLNISRIIWLPYGVVQDTDTDGHVDNMCVFAGVGKVLLSWPKNCGTPECLDKEQEIRSLSALEVLENSRDANGNPFKVIKVPHPPILEYKKEDIKKLPTVEGSYVRKLGVRMDASHVNLIITNKVIVVPTFNCSTDNEAIKIISEVFPKRKVVGVYARDILLGGGNIHCMSQQQPYSTG